MKKLAAVALALATAAIPSVAAARGKVYGSGQGRPLTAPSRAAAADVAKEFVRARGMSGLTMASVRASETRGKNNLTHVRMEQVVDGLRVHGAYARAAVNARGEVVHAIDALVPVGPVRRATVNERQALAAALRELHPGVAAPGELARSGNVTSYLAGDHFHAAPSVERVIVQRDGGLAQGFLVQTWSNEKNLLHYTVVGPDGAVDDVELRTNSDSFRVFAHNPKVGAQELVEAPAGWLSGAQSTGLISGNNARAYLDADKKQNKPDAFGVTVTDGQFTAIYDAASGPATVNNRTVAIQNLFYHNNLIHDTLYAAGFTEAEANFQQDNFGNGGLGADPVQAEAQDGGGLDNANFATPVDGSPPRMQMYLWTGGHEVAVGASGYFAVPAAFSPALTGQTGDLVVGIDANPDPSATDGCETLTNVAGKVALVDRGNCDFVVKAKNAQSAGAIALIVVDTTPGESVVSMGGRGRYTMPSVAVSQVSGAALKASLGTAILRQTDPPPNLRDGDLDADIIWHEYGHGLTWRMIGEMRGPFAGALGEGMSDVLALIHGTNDRVGEYSFSSPVGIRRAPYQDYPNTYGDMNEGTRQVHNDGEVYAAIGWRLIGYYEGAGLSRADLLADLVYGMTFTPARPDFEAMRDGILDGLEANGTLAARECMVWNAFAEYGVGVGADGVETITRRGSTVTVTETFDLPPSCPKTF